MALKTCKKCEIEQNLQNFQKHPAGKDGYSNFCNKCTNERRRKRYKIPEVKQKNSERTKIYRKNNPEMIKNIDLKWRYGIDLEFFNKLKIEQNNCCKICKKVTEKFHVDHDHDTKKVRGLLCSNCNTGIGLFYEDLTILNQAILYLTAYQNNINVNSCISGQYVKKEILNASTGD